jgi:hypothetical protein
METKVYATADSELKRLVKNGKIAIRDVTNDPAPWRIVKVTKFIDKDHIETTGEKSGKVRVYNTNDCEIDLPGEGSMV